MDTTKPIAFVDPELVNVHMMAAAKPGSGRPSLEVLHIERKAGVLHLVTTDGRMLLHTIVPTPLATEGTGEDFSADIRIIGKLKKVDRAPLVIKDGLAIFNTTHIQAFALAEGTNFPKTDAVECVAKAEVQSWKNFNPKQLAIVLKYLGEVGYCNPQPTIVGAPGLWRWVADDETIRTAVVMPINKGA